MPYAKAVSAPFADGAWIRVDAFRPELPKRIPECVVRYVKIGDYRYSSGATDPRMLGHADLVDEVLGWFRREDTNPQNAQLICSLHSLSALDDLEKEEVFIVEKDRAGSTQAYGARDVTGVRRSSNLRKLYRSGALGGLHHFG